MKQIKYNIIYMKQIMAFFWLYEIKSKNNYLKQNKFFYKQKKISDGLTT